MAHSITKAVILAAGVGKRLDRHDSPKPLVKVGGRPMIVGVIQHMQEAGITDIYIVIGHRGDEIKKELISNLHVNARIFFIEQTDSGQNALLKSLFALRDTLTEPFFVSMADLVMEHNPFYLMQDPNESEDMLLYSLVEADASKFERAGALSRVCTDGECITNVGRELAQFNGLEVGVYYVSRGSLPALYALSLESGAKNLGDFLSYLSKEKKLGYKTYGGGEWFDVNTPATHVRANMFVRAQRRAIPTAKERASMKDPVSLARFERTKQMVTEIVLERGIIDRLHGSRLIPESRASSTHFVLTDSVLDPLYGDKIIAGLRRAGYNAHKLVIPAGEASKNISQYARLADEIFSYGLDKGSTIISLGGGVINNIAGVLASTLYRGIYLVHIPTSMMAQVDAAIDFKQAINSASGKNLIGSYYPATHVVIDPNALRTLDARHVRNGIAESIKHAITQDNKFFQKLLNESGRVRNIDFLEHVIRRTIELKVPLLNGDVRNDMNEMLPQYGHSVGHAIEHLSSYDVLHGEAISIGGCVSAEVSRLLRIADDETVEAHYRIAKAFNLPSTVPNEMTAEHICETIRFDKHYESESPHMALPRRIGDMWHNEGVYGIPIDFEILKRAIENNKNKKTLYESK